MPNVAVVAHSRKSLGGGLPELRIKARPRSITICVPAK